MKSVEEIAKNMIEDNINLWMQLLNGNKDKFYDIIAGTDGLQGYKPEPIEGIGEQTRSIYRRWQRKSRKRRL